jgi:hypothetical protein
VHPQELDGLFVNEQVMVFELNTPRRQQRSDRRAAESTRLHVEVDVDHKASSVMDAASSVLRLQVCQPDAGPIAPLGERSPAVLRRE